MVMIRLYTTCKFCDRRVYFEVVSDSDQKYVSYAFRAAMERHLQFHVEEIMEIPYARY